MALQESAARPAMRALGYDGVDVIVGKISEHGFLAETDEAFPPEAFVRLKLPGVGSVYARIVSAKPGRVAGEFVTPLAPARLQRTIGLGSTLVTAR
jgi:hypothetical protein